MADTESVTMPAAEYARIRKLLDEQDIRDCQARIARGADRFDRALYLSACHPDAQISVGGHVMAAADSFEGGMAGHAEGTWATLHCLGTSNCDIDGDTAHVETYHLYCARTKGGPSWAATGRYLDQFERRQGKWGLVFRHIAVEWTGTLGPMDLPLLEAVEGPKTRLSAARDKSDVSYLRPLRG
ncbi:MAG: nuclear transport factor 2 family protein [Novosphingobium sp.]